MFKVETLYADTTARLAAIDMIMSQGNYRVIGSGSYGSVYGDKDSDVVYKMGVVSENGAYLLFIHYLSTLEKKNPFFPKIYGMRIIKCVNDPDYEIFVVAMERLKNIRATDFDADDICGYLEGEKVPESEIAEIMKENKFGSIQKLLEARKFLHKIEPIAREFSDLMASGPDCRKDCWDLHTGNVMYRGSQLVITDPFA